MRLQILLLGIVLGLCTSCCNQNKDMESLKNELRETEIAFSLMSEEKGIKAALIEFADDKGVILRDNSYPIVGKEAIKKILDKLDDSKFTITWEPSFVEVAKSGDLGYVYGIYQIKTADKITSGTYVGIWKRYAKGKWKFVLDSDNEGLENKSGK